MTIRTPMATAMGSASPSAAPPARTRISRISSVAYATEERASDANTARPVRGPSRSCAACAVGIGVPRRIRFTLWTDMTASMPPYSWR